MFFLCFFFFFAFTALSNYAVPDVGNNIENGVGQNGIQEENENGITNILPNDNVQLDAVAGNDKTDYFSGLMNFELNVS